MGKLVKNHWARLIVLTAGAIQLGASIEGFFWPKIFWDFLTTNLDGAVRPVPILQIINLLCAFFALALEWPLPIFTLASTARWDASHRNKNGSGAVQYPSPYQQSTAKAHDPSAARHMQGTMTVTISSSSSASDERLSMWVSVLGGLHSSIEARLLIYPFSCMAALLLYQGTSAGFYYLIGMGIYFWGFSEGEVVMGVPWTLPRRSHRSRRSPGSKV